MGGFKKIERQQQTGREIKGWREREREILDTKAW